MEPRLQRIKELFIVIVLGLIAIAIVIGGNIALSMYSTQTDSSQASTDCNVASVKLYGTLVYYANENSGSNSSASGDGSLDQSASEDIRQQIETADADPSIKAILLQIDSPGGDPVAGETVADALKHATKPTVALVGDEGTSAAYWAATGAQTIFASANSSLVDIGVTQSYLDQTKQNEDDGLTFVPLTAGEYKDMGNPNTPLTPVEKTLIQRDLNIIYDNFVSAVATNRNLPEDKVKALSDGSSMLGAMALQNGLIDKIGTIYDVEDYLKGKIGEKATVCQ